LGLDELLERIRKKDVVVSVVGLGRVGLPLSTVFAVSGLKVYGVDIDEKKLDMIKSIFITNQQLRMMYNLLSHLTMFAT